MATFGGQKVLVVKRFDRLWLPDGRLIRLPQEDICQATSTPSARKYESKGGPGAIAVLNLLLGSDEPGKDRQTVLRALIVFWLLGATDGHAKNFSLSLRPGGAYALTDRGTWLGFRNRQDLRVLVEGDARLFNQYGVILVNPAKHPHVKKEMGQAFVDWLVSPEGQKAIAGFKIGGEQLFFANADTPGA